MSKNCYASKEGEDQNEKLKLFCGVYIARNIYNDDETKLFIRFFFPNKTSCIRNESDYFGNKKNPSMLCYVLMC